jgi:hypothetical protein
VEHEYGEPNAATSLAARTVLPGEPFEAPVVSAVPAPRDVPAEQEMLAPPQWNFGPPAEGEFASPPPPRSFEPATYDPTYGAVVDPHHAPAQAFTPTYATADSLTAPEQFQSLHEFGALPVTHDYEPAAPSGPAYPAPAGYDFSAPPAYPAPQAPAYPSPAGDLPAYPAAASWPAPAQEPTAQHSGGPFVPAQAILAPPMPPVDGHSTGEDADGGRPKSGRRPNTALLALAAVVVLGGGGYFGYTQLTKSDSTDNSTSTPVTSVAPKTPVGSKAATTPAAVTPAAPAAYSYPSRIAGFSLRSGPNAAALQRQITTFSKGAYPAYMGSPAIASYGTPASASVVAITFHPTAGKLPAAFATMLAGVHKPATGNIVGAFAAVPTGAAGGSMTCGSQSGASPITYCVWRGKSDVGMVYMKGRTDVPINQAVTRELRAYAEH